MKGCWNQQNLESGDMAFWSDTGPNTIQEIRRESRDSMRQPPEIIQSGSSVNQGVEALTRKGSAYATELSRNNQRT